MSTDARRWRACPWLRALVFRWYEVRGYAAVSDFQRPFSRDWEDLLEIAGLTSAESRNEAFRDAQTLRAVGLIDLKTVRYRPYQIERVIFRFAAETRLHELFRGELPDPPEPRFEFASVAWASELSCLT